mmetsp:Transcript_30425/g.64203  ORF Transcript_30425/g.64203 Transcript_30425/m.64203 type:complete len:162 (+) Transcript_30425:647-1132(+)
MSESTLCHFEWISFGLFECSISSGKSTCMKDKFACILAPAPSKSILLMSSASFRMNIELLFSFVVAVVVVVVVNVDATAGAPIQSKGRAGYASGDAGSARCCPDEDHIQVRLRGVGHHGMIFVPNVIFANFRGHNVVDRREIAVFDVGSGDSLNGKVAHGG